MIPLIYHYVFLLKMTQLTISTWGVIEGDLLCWGKKSSSKECQKGLRSSYPQRGRARQRGQPPHLPTELRKRAGKCLRDPGTSVPHSGRGGVGMGYLRKEKSPGLPKPSVWVESCPLITHLPPHSSPGRAPDQRIHSFLRF